jgi:hypothetical protein
LLLVLNEVFVGYWFITYPVIIVTASNFAVEQDFSERLIIFALLLPVLKMVLLLVELNDEMKAARENRQYDEEKANSIGPIENELDIPTNIRRMHPDPNWGEKFVAAMKNPQPDDIPPEDGKLLDFPAYKRHSKKPDLPN